MRKVALVTGSTRGIGQATAIALAQKGFDIVVTGRTLKEGTGTVHAPNRGSVPVPGSIESTVAAVRECGRDALGVRLDILDRASIDAALKTVLDTWGHIDVLVNNAIYQGPGLLDAFADCTTDQATGAMTGTFINQLHITREVLKGMVAKGSGMFFFIGSVAGIHAPTLMPGKGGWSILHSATKSAFHRIPEFLNLEHGKDGIQAFLVEPQMTVTETIKAIFGNRGESLGVEGHEPAVTGEVIAWLATRPEAREYLGTFISTPDFHAAHVATG
ncbi:MAG: SDR family oxidoreductase [Proteobacteria bacterium]|nr:SDR family oxidoreductase [Pseudomonadota bacterium]HQR02589.1 SDR family oxidoreductase [Rhodocyclaceae bacterium]